MKIILAVDNMSWIGGVERQVSYLANHLLRQNNKVFIVSVRTEEELNVNDVFYSLENGIVLKSADKRLVTYPSRTIYRRLKRKLNTIYYTVVRKIGQYAYNILKIPRFYYMANIYKILKLKNLMVQINPDIVITSMRYSITYMAFVTKTLKIPHIVVNVCDPVDYLKNNNNYKLINYAINISNKNVILHDCFLEYFPYSIRSKSVVIPRPVFYPHKTAIASPGNESSENVILSVGRMDDQKNHQLLIHAFKLLADKYKNWIVKIYGWPAKRDQMQDLINSLSLKDRVILYEPIKNINCEFQKASIFAFPSLAEGLGNALMEAMAHNLPSVVLKNCKVPALLVTESLGGLVADNNVSDYSSKLEELITNPIKRNLMGENARNYVAKYNPEIINKKWEEIINLTINDS